MKFPERAAKQLGFNDAQIKPGLLAGEVGLPRTFLTLTQVRHPEGTLLFSEAWDARGWLVNSFKVPIYPSKFFGSAPGQNHTSGQRAGGGGCVVSFVDGHALFWQYADPATSQYPGLMPQPTFNQLGLQLGPPVPFKVNSADAYQLEAWSGGPVPPGVTQ